MYSIPIDQGGLFYIPNALPSTLSQECMTEIDKLLEGKMINGSRRTNRYGAKAFGHFGPFERSPLPPTFQNALNHILASHKTQFNQLQSVPPTDSASASTHTHTHTHTHSQPHPPAHDQSQYQDVDWNQVEIVKLSAGTQLFFDIELEQKAHGPLLFVNLSGAHPIALHNVKSNTSISTTLFPPSATLKEQNLKNTLPDNDQTDTTSPPPSSTTSPPTLPPLETRSVLVTPDNLGCVVFSQEAVSRYSRQIKAQSYRTKQLPIKLIPVSDISRVQVGDIDGEQANCIEPIMTSTLLQDFSLILANGMQRQKEKKAARLAWLRSQVEEGKMTEEEFQQHVQRDGKKDASIDASFAEAESNPTDSNGNVQQASSAAVDYVLGTQTGTYKRANAYALIFRQFVEHTPLPENPLAQYGSTSVPVDNNINGDDGDKQGASGQNQNQSHFDENMNENGVLKHKRKQLVEKQQRASKAVPPITINLESMTEAELSEFEKQHVHSVYDNIADHFSGTRYLAWPQVDDFIQKIPDFSILADIGCGNGKYLSVNPKIATIGCDISINLLQLAHEKGCSVAVGDSLAVPFRSAYFDNTISIAVLHHIASRTRRIKAINEMLRITKPGGKVLITVWAQEQDGSGGRIFTQGDVWVPFKTLAGTTAEIQRLKEKRQKEREAKKASVKEIVVKKCEKDQSDKNGQNIQEEQEKQENQENANNEVETSTASVKIDTQLPQEVSPESTRFYHVFCNGEIEDHVNDPAIEYPIEIEQVFYGKGNWCIILKRLEGTKESQNKA